MSDKVFVKGMIVKAPPERAPDFVKCSISVKVGEFSAFAAEHASETGWLNIQVKQSKDGKFYAELDTWKPKGQPQEERRTPPMGNAPVKPKSRAVDMDDEIPFAPEFR